MRVSVLNSNRLYVLCLLLGWGVSDSTYTQNLIPNPGFESYIDCPSESHGLYLASNWGTNIPKNIVGNDIWNQRNYIHSCDPEVEPWWPTELGDGVIAYLHHWDPSEDRSLTQLVWTELVTAPEKDSLYYVEYTTAPTMLYYVPESSYIMPWCVSFNLGIKLAGADFDGKVDQTDPMMPDMTAADSGVARRIRGTSQIGNCFTATGLERYFLFGFFLDDTPFDDYSCIGSNAYKDFGWSFFIADNIKLEKMKLEICCDTTLCEKGEIDFSEYTDYYALPEKQMLWNDGVVGSKRSFSTSGQYRFTMNTSCGSVTSNWVDIRIEDCQVQVFVPNAFSPNGDTVNDLFVPQFSDDYEITMLRLSVFNRWGQLVFQTRAVDTPGWDGTVRGVLASQDNYLWHLEYEYIEEDRAVTKLEYGELMLVR